jgi:CheY-like chemotaxis protein
MDTLTIPAGSKRIEMGVIPEGPVPRHLHGDPVRLRQVLMNLVGNAVKFTDTGEVTVGVRVLAEESTGTRLRFDVNDTGPGICAEDRHRLFRKFSQLDYHSTRRHQGTGLGLAISKDLVRLMEGDIGVESEDGPGSTFWFTAVMQTAAETANTVFDGMRMAGYVPGRTLRNIISAQLLSLGVEADLFSDEDAMCSALREADGEGKRYQLLLADHSQLPEAVEQQILASNIEMCSTRFCKVSLDWADGLPHGNESLWDGVLSRPVTWRKLSSLLLPAAETTADINEAYQAGAGGYTGNVLLVEDAPALQLVTQVRLEKLGCRVEVACNGREAVEAVEGNDFALVLMDIQMPEMDGMTATRLIREMPESCKANIPIIALTANAMKGDEQEYLAAGMNDYLTKPVDSASLTTVLKRWLN